MKNKHIFDDNRNVKRFVIGFIIVCALIFPLDLAVRKHPHFQWEMWTGFYAVFGFASSVILVLIAKNVLRPLVKREEKFYDD